ncbi:MAG TPA: DUF3821 domain-containing protein [Methanoregulaceae archaeon]|nr:DUF3821 domain-containing protein [Methanoregulaceae archaeon]
MPPHHIVLISIVISGIILITAPVGAVLNIVPQGGDVFIGENGLDVSSFISSGQVISWYSSSQIPGIDPPVVTLTISDADHFYVDPGSFIPYGGNWYIGTTSQVAFVVIEPSVGIRVLDQTTGKDVTNKSAPFGDFVNFAIDNNFYPISERPGYDPSKDGFLTIRVRNADGTVYKRLLQDPKVSIPLGNLTDSITPFYWVDVNNSGQGWNTGMYPIGSSYQVRAVSDANGMDINYPLSGKTVSTARSVVVGFPADVIVTPKPTITPPTPQPTITPPTPQPTITPPTPQPTIIPPTPQPTIIPPTPQPTIIPPTPQPTITLPTPQPTIIPPSSWQSTEDLLALLPLMTFTEKDNGKTITLDKNDVIAVSLDENPSTGFSWIMKNTSGIEILKDTFTIQEPPIPSSYQVAGRGGVRTWTLKMTGLGTQIFNGTYKQPWMPDSDTDERYGISFNVI